MSEFTKGPWVIHTPEQTAYKPTIGSAGDVFDDGYKNVCDVRGPAIKFGSPSTETAANAHLISAAPDMYKLLFAIKKYGMLNTKAETLAIELDEVLAKARGES